MLAHPDNATICASLIALTFSPELSCFWLLSFVHVTANVCSEAVFIQTEVKRYHEGYVGSSEIANNLLATFADAFGVES